MLFFLLLINVMFIDLNCFSQVSDVAHGPLVLKSPHLTPVFQCVSEKNTLSFVIKLEETIEEMKSWNTHLSSI